MAHGTVLHTGNTGEMQRLNGQNMDVKGLFR